MSIRPTSWYQPWRVRFKVHSFEPSYLNANSVTYCTVSGREQSFVFANWNERYDSAHYYTSIYPMKKAGFDAGYGHAIGISILYGYNYTNSAHYRTFEVDYFDCDGCTVELLDTPVKWGAATWLNNSSLTIGTYYNGVSNMDATSRGLQESGDANNYDRLQMSSTYPINGSTLRFPPYTLFGYSPDGKTQSFSLYNAGYTSSTTGINTARVYNTAGIDWTRGINYYSGGSNLAVDANLNISAMTAFSAIDLRYSDNCAATSAATTLGLVQRKPVYFRGTIESDGLFHIAPLSVTYNNNTYQRAWTQDIPTTEDGYVYWFIGYPYYNSSYAGGYQIDLFENNPLYWYHNGSFQQYTPNGGVADSVPWSGITDKPSTFTPSSHSHGNITNAGELSTATRAVVTDANKKITVADLTVSSATAESTTATTFVHSVTQDAQGKITVKTRPLPTYNNYSLPLAASGTRGGIQIGYTQSGQNYPVQLSSEKAYVNVPWTDTKVTQKIKSDNNDYRIILSYEANDTDNVTNTVNKASNLRYNPSLNKLSTGNMQLTGEIDVTGNATFHNQTQADSLTAGSLLVNGAANFVQSPTAPTPADGDSSTKVATTAFIKWGNVAGKPSSFTPSSHSHGNITNAGELSTANRAVITDGNKKITISSVTSTELGYLSGVTSAIQTQLNAKAPLASPALTGTPTAPTAAAGTNTTQIATTAFVANSIASLSTAMHFIGKATVAITDGSTTDPTISGYDFTADRKPGDVIIDTDNAYEYVWTYEGKWERLGPDGSYKITQSAVDTGAATTNKWVSRIQQDTNGVVTATLSALDTSGTWSGKAAKLTDLNASDSASSTTGWRKVWFSYSDGVTGRPALSDVLAFQTSTGTLKATIFSGSGASLTNLNASNISSGTLAAARLPSVTRTNNTSTASPAHSGTFTTIDSITTDTYGRVTAVNTKTITLPSDNNTTYTFTDGIAGNFIVTPSGGSAQTVSIGKPNTASTADKVEHPLTLANGRSYDGSADVTLLTNDLTPVITKTYPAYTCSADNEAKGVLFFGRVTNITSSPWQAPWAIHYRVYVSTTENNTQGWYDCYFSVSGSTVNYYNYNNFYSTDYRPIYNHRLLYPKSGYTSYGAYFGVRVQSARTPTTLARTFTVELIETKNCTVEFLENIQRFDETYITTNSVAASTIWYNTDYNATAVGLQEAGDANTNDTAYYILTNSFRGVAGSTYKVWRYSLFARLPDGTYESFTNTYGEAATKTKNPHGFLPDGKIYWNSNSSDYTGVFGISAYEQYHSINYRYTFNFSGNGIPASANTYIKWTYNTVDGLLYLADEWFATALPSTEDGFIYQRVGSNYYNSADYRGSLLLNNPYYIYTSDGIKTWTPQNFIITGGTNKITVSPLGSTSYDVTVTPSITNNITGSGTSGYLTKFNGTNTITNGPQLSSAISSQSQTTKFLREDGTWAAPSYTDAGVTGVKGNAETNYRTGNVNLTPANIGAAAASHTHYELATIGDQRTTATTPNTYANRLIFQGLKTNSSFGSPSTDTYSYVVGLRGWSDSSGGNSHELAFNNTGIFWRSGATTSWGNWYRIYTTGNKPTASDVGLGNVTNDAQIPKSIGTTKGDIIYWSAASTPARLGIGSAGQVLKVSSDGVPVWSSDNNSVTGVKGNAETDYRTGNVNLTPANIGAIGKNDELLTTNPFAPVSLRGPYISKIDNAFYAADKRWTVTATNYSNSIASLFDGNYESWYGISNGATSIITMDFSNTSTGFFPGYPYGYILISFYHNAKPTSISARVYCNYESHGIGWHNISFSPVSDNTSGAITYRSEHQGYYQISQLEITIVGDTTNGSGMTKVSQIEMHLDRPDSKLTPFLSKYGPEILYYNLTSEAQITATQFNGPLNGNAATATKATNDSDGNAINTTYIKKSVLSGAYDIMYSSAANTPTRLAANTTTTKKFLRMTGTGSVGAAPAWDTVTKSDVGLSNVTNHQQVHEVAWDSTNKKVTRSKNGTAGDVVQFKAGTNISLSADSTSLTITNNATDTLTGTPSASKTITAFDQVNGAITATFADISITKSQITDFPTTMTPASHTHGNITNDGKLGTASVAVVTDSNKNITTADLSVSDPTASGTGITYIATISQSAVGKITVTKSTVRSATTGQTGVVQLTDSTSSTSTTTAATPNSVKSAYDLANNHKYWANVESTSAAQYDKEPVVKTVTIGNGSGTTAPTKKVELVYDATLEVLNFVFS